MSTDNKSGQHTPTGKSPFLEFGGDAAEIPAINVTPKGGSVEPTYSYVEYEIDNSGNLIVAFTKKAWANSPHGVRSTLNIPGHGCFTLILRPDQPANNFGSGVPVPNRPNTYGVEVRRSLESLNFLDEAFHNSYKHHFPVIPKYCPPYADVRVSA